MSRVPTVEELVQAALDDSDAFEIGSPPAEKIAATVSNDLKSDVVILEETASELEAWADETDKQAAEVEKVAAAEKIESRHDAIFKLAMASTVLQTLHDLDEHGQLGSLVEEAVPSEKLSGRERVLQPLKR